MVIFGALWLPSDDVPDDRQSSRFVDVKSMCSSPVDEKKNGLISNINQPTLTQGVTTTFI